jgi:cholesterol transport system auxiliary component
MRSLTMEHTSSRFVARWRRSVAAGLSLLALGACSLLKPTATPPPAFYSLDRPQGSATAAAPAAAPTLVVNPPTAAPGFDSQRIIYVRETHKLEYFAHSEWVDPPSRMLMPLLVAAVEATGAFRAVVLTPSAATGDLRLDTEIIRLQHEFLTQPSRVRFTLRAYLVDDKTRRVLAWSEFDAAVPAATENPYGGVVAANRAVQTVLADLAAFCAEAARNTGVEK